MIYLRTINNDTKGHRMYLPPELIRQLGWFKGDQIAVTVDAQRRIILDKITPERYPELFKVSPEEITK